LAKDVGEALTDARRGTGDESATEGEG